MTGQGPENPGGDEICREDGGIARSRSLTVIAHTGRTHSVLVAIRRFLHRTGDTLQRIPLAYKLSFFITVLVVSCMVLLGVILVQQQTSLLQEQINEQGSTLVRLMAKAAREPLLADDELALDAITSGFASNNIVGTAIATLDGDIISQAGVLLEERNPLTRKEVDLIIDGEFVKHAWSWRRLYGGREQAVMSFLQPVIFHDVTAGFAVVTLNQAEMLSAVKTAINAIIGTTIIIITLGIAMSFMLGRRITQPIHRLVSASHAIGSGDYSFRFKDQRKDELGHLMEAFNEMAEGMLEKSQVKSALSRYVSPGVAREILSNLDDVGLSGKRIEGTVVFADIKGFTQISERIKPEELVSILNRYFTLVTRACEINNGMVDKYLGDGVMLVFGAPEPDEDHAFNAICCALLIQRLIEHENIKRSKQQLFPVQFRIGVNTGSMLAGNMGSAERMEYTVVGDTVNLASRLCGITNAGEIVISREMYLRNDISTRVLAGEYQAIRLRGISQPVSTYRVEQLIAQYQESIEQQFEKILQMESTEPEHEQV
ncbi:MAG: adenylate/guanylate cyclase domain-containing protein [Thiohalobacterales bacterium]|nr:adenylate/guanylate cyclase domain-containing protein [Thiohalobacterales bacterium]